MGNMIHNISERQGVCGSLPFLTTIQPNVEVCIMADQAIPQSIKVCKVDGCGRKHHAHGQCKNHYYKFKRLAAKGKPFSRRDPNAIELHGDVAHIILRDGGCHELARAIVDTDDLPILREYVWSYNVGSGYAYSHSHGPTVMMHKLIAKTPEGMLTDHINSNRLDNRKANLRHATMSQNCCHQLPQKKEGKHSKYKGVCLLDTFYTLKRPWIAYVQINRKRKYLGYFDTQEAAALAYNEAAKELHGEYACLNEVSA